MNIYTRLFARLYADTLRSLLAEMDTQPDAIEGEWRIIDDAPQAVDTLASIQHRDLDAATREQQE